MIDFILKYTINSNDHNSSGELNHNDAMSKSENNSLNVEYSSNNHPVYTLNVYVRIRLTYILGGYI